MHGGKVRPIRCMIFIPMCARDWLLSCLLAVSFQNFQGLLHNKWRLERKVPNWDDWPQRRRGIPGADIQCFVLDCLPLYSPSVSVLPFCIWADMRARLQTLESISRAAQTSFFVHNRPHPPGPRQGDESPHPEYRRYSSLSAS